jgi:predicted nuclease of predicted toxin-antitoxin system
LKLLLDQNLSAGLIEKLQNQYPGSAHVRHFKLTGAEDAENGSTQKRLATAWSRRTKIFTR